MIITKEIIDKEGLTDRVVERMIEMAEEQSPEWLILYENLTDDQFVKYSKVKSTIIKKKRDLEYSKMSQQELEVKYLKGFQHAAHHVIGLTLGDELLLKAKERKEEKFTFFWATKSPFSQWYKCNFMGERIFRTPDYLDKFKREILFTSAEQFMMYHKCLLSLDFNAGQQVLSTKDPKKQKQIGRSVKTTKEILETWEVFKTYVVYDGNKAKFTQNKDLKQTLLATKGTTLVEASPSDKMWGIGLTEDNPRAQKRETWEGKNLLGEILTKIRIEITGEY
ncbi:NADAR family protein [Tenacibaculum maritimum]|uniref:NADAR family protein n=1 Tax=Tenacibaculum maritimum TaxID=107401 RepID=UPI003876A216